MFLLRLFILIGFPLLANATAQQPDLLVYKGDTLRLFANPLYPVEDTMKTPFFSEEKACGSTDCWRGYQAVWLLRSDTLYLCAVRNCQGCHEALTLNLSAFFGTRCVNGLVKADWVTDRLYAPQGALLRYVHMGYESIYERETEFQIEQGRLVGTRELSNSRTRISSYEQDWERFKTFVYSRVNWVKIPSLGKREVKVFASFYSVGQQGRLDSIRIMRGAGPVFDNEVIRILKLVSGWSVYYQHGEPIPSGWTIPVVFNKANRRKY